MHNSGHLQDAKCHKKYTPKKEELGCSRICRWTSRLSAPGPCPKQATAVGRQKLPRTRTCWKASCGFSSTRPERTAVRFIKTKWTWIKGHCSRPERQQTTTPWQSPWRGSIHAPEATPFRMDQWSVLERWRHPRPHPEAPWPSSECSHAHAPENRSSTTTM